MSFALTSSGLTIQTYQEIYDEIVADYQGIYGSDINTDPDSPDGQRIGIEAKARLDIQTQVLALYNQLDPDKAIGEMLNKLIKYAGITRRAATRSQADVTVTTDRALTLPNGYTVEDDLGQNWITTASTPLISGANAVTLVAEEYGQVEADAATITEPVTIVIGVLSVTNTLAATAGVDEETDEELRLRRQRSVENPAASTVGGLFSALGDLSGVTDLAIYENDQDTTDTVRNIGPHEIWCVVEGGTIADIVETIAKNKTGGTSLKGDVTGTFTETLTKPDESTYTVNHDMAFDRPTTVDLYLQLTVTADPGESVDEDAIRAALVARTFFIGESVASGELYKYAYDGGDNFTVTDFLIGTDGVTYVDTLISPGYDGVFEIIDTPTRIDITLL